MISVATQQNPKLHNIGTGVIAKDQRDEIVTGWNLIKRKNGNENQDDSKGIKLALIKAREAV